MSTEKGGIHIVQPMVSKKEGLDYTPNATKLQTVSPKNSNNPDESDRMGRKPKSKRLEDLVRNIYDALNLVSGSSSNLEVDNLKCRGQSLW